MADRDAAAKAVFRDVSRAVFKMDRLVHRTPAAESVHSALDERCDERYDGRYADRQHASGTETGSHVPILQAFAWGTLGAG
jgi:hypothetical protein